MQRLVAILIAADADLLNATNDLTVRVTQAYFDVLGAQDVLTTAQAASKVPATMIGSTLAMYLTLYAVVIVAYISVVFHLARKAGKSKDDSSQSVIPGQLRSAQ